MWKTFVLAFLICAFSAAAAKADSFVPIFWVSKVINPAVKIRVLALLDGNCHVKSIDFKYLDTATNSQEDPSPGARCFVLGRLQKGAMKPDNRAACNNLKPAIPKERCSDLPLTAPEISLVPHGLKDANLIVRSVRETNGSCTAGAYIDDGSTENGVQIREVNAVGAAVEHSRTSYTATLKSLNLNLLFHAPMNWLCSGPQCTQKISIPTECVMKEIFGG
jgi:hypothetical protein